MALPSTMVYWGCIGVRLLCTKRRPGRVDPDAFIVAFRSSELDLAGEIDAVDDVLEGLGGDGELMLLVIVP